MTGLKVERLGETSAASTISYLDNAVVFVGSSYGDSQVSSVTVHFISTNDKCACTYELSDTSMIDFCSIGPKSED